MKTETRYTHFNCMSVFDQTTSFIQVPSLNDCTCNACTFPALIHFFLAFRFWTYIAGTLVISSHLSSFKSVFSWLYFTQQGRLFYNSNWHKLLLVICYLQTAWVVPQVTSEGPNPLPWSKARSWFAKPRWYFLATECIRDVGWHHNFSCLCYSLHLYTVKILRLCPCASIWPLPRANLSGSQKSLPWQHPVSWKKQATHYLLSPTPAYTAKGSPYKVLQSLMCSLPEPCITRKCMYVQVKIFYSQKRDSRQYYFISSLLSVLFRLLVLALGKTKAVSYTEHTKCGSCGEKKNQNVTKQARPRFMGMLRSSLCHKLHCISAGQATHLCQSISWENALPLKDSPKLLQPNPFRGQEAHKATPRNPFKLMMKWLKWGHFCLKDTKHCRSRVGSQNHRIS